jgi:hypothetical protein
MAGFIALDPAQCKKKANVGTFAAIKERTATDRDLIHIRARILVFDENNAN